MSGQARLPAAATTDRGGLGSGGGAGHGAWPRQRRRTLTQRLASAEKEDPDTALGP
jgi:hypothetical protein